jgi:hypothetical protein
MLVISMSCRWEKSISLSLQAGRTLAADKNDFGTFVDHDMPGVLLST